MRVTVYGDYIDLAEELEQAWHTPARHAAREAGQMLTAEVRRLLTLRSGTARTVAPPGEPPERDTGTLLAGVSQISVRRGNTVASSGVQVTHPGAARLEWGATDVQGRRTLARPYLRAALANTEGPITAMLEERFSGDVLARQDKDVVVLPRKTR